MTARSCIIACTPRSGSWLLADALDGTGLAGHPEEYFRPDHTVLWRGRWGLPPSGPYEDYVAAAVASGSTPNGVFGVKLHWYQFDWLLRQLHSAPGGEGADAVRAVESVLPEPRYLFLRRRDTARQAISYYRAARSQVWFVLDDEPVGSVGPVGVTAAWRQRELQDEEPDYLAVRFLEDALVAHEANWRDYFARNGIEAMEIVYEDFVAEYEATVRAVLAFLGQMLPPRFVLAPPSLRRQSDALSEQMLADYLRRRPHLTPAPAGTVWSREAGGLVRPDASLENAATPEVASASRPSIARPSLRY